MSMPAAFSAAARPGPTPLMNWISVEGVIATTLLCWTGGVLRGVEGKGLRRKESRAKVEEVHFNL